jgi:hypothetical protein
LKKLALFLAGIALGHAAHADGGDLRNAAGAVAGIYASIYVHELGHAAAFKANGATDIRIYVPGPQCKLLCGLTTAIGIRARFHRGQPVFERCPRRHLLHQDRRPGRLPGQ